jgi:hypothetical protein
VKAALAAAAVLVAVAPAAHAHPLGPEHGGYYSTFSNVHPPVLGLQVAILGGVERLRVSNLSGQTLVIFGPEGAPFLRFTSKAVYRYEPVTAGWHQVAAGSTYAWAEPRISWTEDSPPEEVVAAPGETHFIRDWTIPGRVGGTAVQIRGFLGWAPHTDGASADGRAFVLAFALTGVAILAATLLYVARRRTSSSSRSA